MRVINIAGDGKKQPSPVSTIFKDVALSSATGPFLILGARSEDRVLYGGSRAPGTWFIYHANQKPLGVASALAGPPSFSFFGNKLVYATSGRRGLKRELGAAGSGQEFLSDMLSQFVSLLLDGPMRPAQ